VIAMRSMIDRLKQWGCVDVASGLMTRRIVEGRLTERQQEMQRFGWPFGVMLVEVDLLQEIRSIYAEEGVAEAIKMAAMCVTNSLRTFDTVGRWDEKTFLAIVANTTTSELISITERVRAMVDSAYRVMPQGELHVTVSIGAAGADQRDNAATLLLKAERCLYASRTQGRNRVTIHGLTPEKTDGV
jgi:diguanylate cyclase (GGDEF)-like protein